MRSLLLTPFIAAVLAGPALSQGAPLCYPRSVIADTLAANYHEAPVARMLMGEGAVMEIFASVDCATATVIVVQPNGTACMVQTGEGFELVAAPVVGQPS